MADEAPVAVVEGPRGKAEIYEVMGESRVTEYRVKHSAGTDTYQSLGEAYIEAGEAVGAKT